MAEFMRTGWTTEMIDRLEAQAHRIGLEIAESWEWKHTRRLLRIERALAYLATRLF